MTGSSLRGHLVRGGSSSLLCQILPCESILSQSLEPHLPITGLRRSSNFDAQSTAIGTQPYVTSSLGHAAVTAPAEAPIAAAGLPLTTWVRRAKQPLPESLSPLTEGGQYHPPNRTFKIPTRRVDVKRSAQSLALGGHRMAGPPTEHPETREPHVEL